VTDGHQIPGIEGPGTFDTDPPTAHRVAMERGLASSFYVATEEEQPAEALDAA